MKKREISWHCSCGNDVIVSESQLLAGRAICPKCKKKLDPSKPDPTEISAADTQMINIQDMARMAQDGIAVEISGEWDTSGTDGQKNKKKKP